MMERMLSSSSATSALTPLTVEIPPTESSSSSSMTLSSLAVDDIHDLDVLKKEMLRREHKNEIEKMKLQAHLLRVRGRVHVKVRVRPPNAEEVRSQYKIVGEAVGSRELAFMDPRSDRWRPFAFDGVHGVDATQSDVFADVASMSSLVVDGMFFFGLLFFCNFFVLLLFFLLFLSCCLFVLI